MYKLAANVTDEAQQPQNQQDYEDCDKHLVDPCALNLLHGRRRFSVLLRYAAAKVTTVCRAETRNTTAETAFTAA